MNINPFDQLEIEAKRNTVYNSIHFTMVNMELDNLRKIDRMEIEREEACR